jgi:hypothetical protein
MVLLAADRQRPIADRASGRWTADGLPEGVAALESRTVATSDCRAAVKVESPRGCRVLDAQGARWSSACSGVIGLQP